MMLTGVIVVLVVHLCLLSESKNSHPGAPDEPGSSSASSFPPFSSLMLIHVKGGTNVLSSSLGTD